jgi:hypothetical protein
MKQPRGILTIIMLILSPLLVTAQTVDVLEQSISIALTQGATQTDTFTVQNTGTNAINISITHNLDLIDNDGDQITLTFSDPGQITPSQSATVTITATADTNMDFETYKGTVTVTDPVSGDSDTFSLSISVQPDVCDFGEIGNDLVLDIEDPDSSDDFEPGDRMAIEVTVDNIGDDDVRTQVEAFLFSDKSEVANAASKTINIEDGNDEEFKFELQIPLDSRKIDEDDDFTLYVKAFDDNNEKLNCVQEDIPINIELASRKVIFDKQNTRFLPAAATCGDTVLANVHVINIGSKDNNQVSISLFSQELGISHVSDIFEIEKFSSDEDNDETRQFSIKVPKNIIGRTYQFTTTVNYEGGSKTTAMPLEIVSCDSPTLLVQQGKTLARVIPVDAHLFAIQGSIISIPVKVLNEQTTKESFIVTLTSLGELGSTTQKFITLNPDQESTLFLDLQVHEDTTPVIHTAIIEVRLEGVVVASETVAVEVIEKELERRESSITTLFYNVPLAAWIIIDLIVIGVLVIIITTLVKNRKH